MIILFAPVSIIYKLLFVSTIKAHGEDFIWLAVMEVTELGSGAGLHVRTVVLNTVFKNCR